jgi:hypothetical protein
LNIEVQTPGEMEARQMKGMVLAMCYMVLVITALFAIGQT